MLRMNCLHNRFIWCGCLILVICSVRCHDEDAVSRISIDETTKTNAVHITPERVIDGDVFPFARKYYVYKDSILIIQNRSENAVGNQSIPYFEFRRLSDMSLIKQSINRGNGPNEILNILCEFQDSRLYVVDFVKNRFGDLSVDYLLENEKPVLDLKERTFRFGNFKRFKNDYYLFDNINCFADKGLKIKQKASRFIIGDGSVGDTKEYKYKTFNVNQGKILVNPERERVLYFNPNQPEMELYDYDLILLRKIIAPDELFGRLNLTGNNNVVFYGAIPWYFCNYTYDEDHIFITYHGLLLLDDTSRIPALIFEFDWNGNFVAGYNPHEPVVTLTLSENDNRVLYITSTDSLGQPVLDKLVLPSI